MTQRDQPDATASEVSEERRAFLLKAGKTAAVAPAAALLLAATGAKGSPVPSGFNQSF